MELKLISLLSGAIGGSILTMVSLPPTALFPVTEIVIISVLEITHQVSEIPPLPGTLALNQVEQEQIAQVNLNINSQVGEILTIEQQKEFKTVLDRDLCISTALDSISTYEQPKK